MIQNQTYMNQTPYSQMQQLVSHWNTLMKPPSSKKRSRNESDMAENATRQRTQDYVRESSTPNPKCQTLRMHEPIAHSFS